VKELWKETTYAIQVLDIRDCPIEDLSVLQRFVHLKRLNILPGQFKPEQLEFLPPWVNVVEKKLNSEPGE
jgi:hypothetical protein